MENKEKIFPALVVGMSLFVPFIIWIVLPWIQLEGWFSFRQILACAGVTAFLILVAARALGVDPTPRRIAGFAVLGLILSPVLLRFPNAFLDTSDSVVYRLPVETIYSAATRRRELPTFAISVRSWIRRGEFQELSLQPWDYLRVGQGSVIYIEEKAGYLGVPWYRYYLESDAPRFPPEKVVSLDGVDKALIRSQPTTVEAQADGRNIMLVKYGGETWLRENFSHLTKEPKCANQCYRLKGQPAERIDRCKEIFAKCPAWGSGRFILLYLVKEKREREAAEIFSRIPKTFEAYPEHRMLKDYTQAILVAPENQKARLRSQVDANSMAFAQIWVDYIKTLAKKSTR